MIKLKKAFIILLAAVMLACTSCDEKTTPIENTTDNVIETVDTEPTTPEPVVEEETDPEPVPEPEPEVEEEEPEPEALPDEAEKIEEAESDITAYSDEADTEEDKNPVTKNEPVKEEIKTEASGTDSDVNEPEEEKEPERIYNYLNGFTCTEEEQNKRPLAIMINNIKKCLPQEGITAGDMYYECSAEGGITRIMMLVSDYEKLGTLGSVRSSRDYFVDFLANHDAIYVHAGGSALAYEKISWRGINNLDGVNMYVPNMFWRDQYRMNNMGYEHSLMTNGAGVASGIAFKKYPTEHTENYVNPFKFYDENTNNKLVGSPASHVRMKMTSIQTVDFVYDEKTGEYLRYQYDGMPHVDASTGEQLSVKNVIILFTDISVIPGDTAGRLAVGTVGSGQGYYITNGKRKVIKWQRDGKTTPIHIEYRNGDEFILNAGKTYICVVDNSVASKIDFEYKW